MAQSKALNNSQIIRAALVVLVSVLKNPRTRFVRSEVLAAQFGVNTYIYSLHEFTLSFLYSPLLRADRSLDAPLLRSLHPENSLALVSVIRDRSILRRSNYSCNQKNPHYFSKLEQSPLNIRILNDL